MRSGQRAEGAPCLNGSEPRKGGSAARRPSLALGCEALPCPCSALLWAWSSSGGGSPLLQPCLEHGDPSRSSAGLVGLGEEEEEEEVCASGSGGCSVLGRRSAAARPVPVGLWEGKALRLPSEGRLSPGFPWRVGGGASCLLIASEMGRSWLWAMPAE